MAKKMTLKSKPQAAETTKELKLRSVSQIFQHRSWCFYGRAGTGKTTLAGSFPKPLMLLNVKDQGTDSVSDYGDSIQVNDTVDWDEFELAYWWLKKNPTAFKTVVIDTITQVQQLAIEKVLADKGDDPSKAGEWGSMTKKEWGQVASMMKTWITNFRDLPMEVVFLAQDRVSETETEDPEVMIDPEVGPRLTPSIASHINAEVSVVGNTFLRRKVKITTDEKTKKKKEVATNQYCLRLGPDAVYVTKARKPKSIKLPGVLTDPTYDKLIETLTGE